MSGCLELGQFFSAFGLELNIGFSWVLSLLAFELELHRLGSPACGLQILGLFGFNNFVS